MTSVDVRVLLAVALYLGIPCLAQPYRCDWGAVGIAGGGMSDAAHRCGATAGQAAAGQMASELHRAQIGFWQPSYGDTTAVREQVRAPDEDALATRLYPPTPSLFRAHTTISYALASESRATIQVHDLTGRVVRVLHSGSQKPGRYRLRWDGRDGSGRIAGSGVYFCRMLTTEINTTQKLVKME